MANMTDEDRIATAITWAKGNWGLGIPDDISPADCRIIPLYVQRQAMESTRPLQWPETEWDVIIRDRWVVHLDTMGVPDGPPRRVR